MPNPPDINSTAARAASSGLIFGCSWGFGWLLFEGLFLSLSLGDIPAWAGLLNPGAGAPFIIALSCLVALLAALWPELNALNPAAPSEPLSRRLRAWLWEGSKTQNTWRSAYILTGVVLGVAWVALGVSVGAKILTTVVTPGFGAALLLLSQLLAGAALLLITPIIALPTIKLLEKLQAGNDEGSRLLRPGSLLTSLTVLGLVGVGLLWLKFGDVMKHLPWVLVLAPLFGLGFTKLTTRFMNKRPGVWASALLIGVVALGVFVLFLPTRLGDARSLLIGRNSVASAWVGWLEQKLDSDDDGTSSFFAGGDCAPDNPEIGPNKMEIVGNGLDDDCAAGDLEINPDDYTMGKNHHPTPAGIVEKPHVIFITTDALSFRHTSLGGYHRDTTPHLKEWAQRATVYENAFSTSASTRLSFPGIVTGMLNSMVKMNNRRIHPYPYDKSVRTLGSIFKNKGYRTVHMMGDSYFGKKKWGGYLSGFDIVDEEPYKTAADKGHTAAELTEAALKHLEAEDERPLFLWIHYYDHHEPYDKPANSQDFGSREVDRYDSELHHTDKFWGLLLAEIESRWNPEEYVVVFTSDHGEAFDVNHPKEHHDFSLHSEVLHVPLIIQAPWGRGTRIEGLSSHLDIMPTLADLAGIRTNPRWIGESLVPSLADGKALEKQVVYSMFYIPEDAKHGRDGFRRFGVRTKDFYYFANYKRNTHTLVRWKEDRLDRNNLYHERAETAALYRFLAADKLDWLRKNERGLKHLRKKKKPARARPKQAGARRKR